MIIELWLGSGQGTGSPGVAVYSIPHHPPSSCEEALPPGPRLCSSCCFITCGLLTGVVIQTREAGQEEISVGLTIPPSSWPCGERERDAQEVLAQRQQSVKAERAGDRHGVASWLRVPVASSGLQDGQACFSAPHLLSSPSARASLPLSDSEATTQHCPLGASLQGRQMMPVSRGQGREGSVSQVLLVDLVTLS